MVRQFCSVSARHKNYHLLQDWDWDLFVIGIGPIDLQIKIIIDREFLDEFPA